MIRSGRRGFRTTGTALTELRSDLGHFRGEPVKLLLVTNNGHFQNGVIYL